MTHPVNHKEHNKLIFFAEFPAVSAAQAFSNVSMIVSSDSDYKLCCIDSVIIPQTNWPLKCSFNAFSKLHSSGFISKE